MKVMLIGSTSVDFEAYSVMAPQAGTSDADYLGTFSGRCCYQSFDRPNPKTAHDADYLANIIDMGHESVLSHASASFYVTGVSRSLTHELVRHRWLSFSELSQRYVRPDDFRPVYPPAATGEERVRIDETFGRGIAAYEKAVAEYESMNVEGKRAREAARAHLPGCTETRIVVSSNLRGFRDMLKQRLGMGADREIMTFAVEVHRLLKEIAPYTFRDLDDMALVAKSVL